MANTDTEDITLEPTPDSQHDVNATCAAPTYPLSRLIRHPNQKLIFMGDHANSSFLHSVRRVVQKAVGSCSFIDDPTRNRLVDGIEAAPLDWLRQGNDPIVHKPDPELATVLLHQYLWTTNGVLDLLNDDEIKSQFPNWLETVVDVNDSTSAKYYLVLALGAQSSAECSDQTAELYFKCGRFMTMLHFMDKPSLLGVQCFLLVTMFLVVASRRNAAAMNLGLAAHASYAIGIHQQDASKLFKVDEYQERENAWKSIRALDVLLSGSLGRPLATSETRNVAEDGSSAVVHLCWISERILTKVYSRRSLAMETVEEISKHHRKWVSLLPESLPRDRILPALELGEEQKPNLGLSHLRCEYYVSIILLTRPFLLDLAVKSAKENATSESSSPQPSTISLERALVYSSVDSAIRIIETVRPLLKDGNLPKRLPIIVNAAFMAGLVIGLAFFARLRRHFPLYEGLGDALRMLSAFSEHDIVARRGLLLLRNLEAACRLFVANQDCEKYKCRQHLVTSLFGDLRSLDSNDEGSSVYHHDRDSSPDATRRQNWANVTGDSQGPSTKGVQVSDIDGLRPPTESDLLPNDSIFAVPLGTAQDGGRQREEHGWQPQVDDDAFLLDANVHWNETGAPFGPAFANLSTLVNNYWGSDNIFSLD
ncbi:hypothetical protein H2200_008191 [Cladophialophora chaetospira]|uniref:Transcription factor domain-containing protein n=1 Tax=Cladophialophora chaetospira TaxID=386627 RepID=A0AA39CFW3_9EURO|nr:hypothetical protein H2200_008191 [Cladophialophora chaetospira]